MTDTASTATPTRLGNRLPPANYFRAVHSTAQGAPLHQALTACTPWRQAAQQLAALPPWSASPVGEGEAAMVVADLVEAAVATGRDLNDPDLHAEAGRAYAEAQGRGLVAGGIDRLRSRLAGELDGAVTTHQTTILRHLHGQLEDTLDQARRTLTDLAGVHDAQAAIDADVTDAWADWQRLAPRYVAIREAQRTFMRAIGAVDGQAFRPHLFLRTPAAVDRDFLPRLLGWDTGTATDRRRPADAPWPALESAEGLRWIASHPEAGPWVPTVKELEEAEAATERAAHTIRTHLARVPLARRVVSDDVLALAEATA